MSYVRKEIIGDCTLYQADCADLIPTLGKFDACITDPPYGINVDVVMAKKSCKQYGSSHAPCSKYIGSGWDEKPLEGDLLNLVLMSSELLIIWGGNYFALPPTSCWLIWDKENGANNFADCEMAWTNLKKAVRLKKHQWNGMLRKGNEQRLGHPTQKPLALMKWCLTHVPNAKTIFDPFMGSGTTGVACVQAGLSFTGIERDAEYFDIACKRIEKAYAQPDLFIAPAEKKENAILPF